MHLLFVNSMLSDGTQENAIDIANDAVLLGLKQQGFKITEIGYQWSGTNSPSFEGIISLGTLDVRNETASAQQKLQWLGKAIMGGIPFASAKLRVASHDEVADAIAKAEQMNGPAAAIIFNGISLAGAYEKAFAGRPFVYIADQAEALAASLKQKDASNFIEKFLYWREALVMAALEMRLAQKAAVVLAFNRCDLSRLGKDGAQKQQVSGLLPLTSGTMTKAPSDGRIKSFDIGLCGDWTDAHKRQDFEWFMQQVVPHLPPKISIAVAGPMQRGMRARDKRVVVLGKVNHEQDFLRQCRIVALPAQNATGPQLETSALLENGLAVVGTSSALGGVFHLPPNVMIEDKPKKFAAALTDCLSAEKSGLLPAADGAEFIKKQNDQLKHVLQEMEALLTAQPH